LSLFTNVVEEEFSEVRTGLPGVASCLAVKRFRTRRGKRVGKEHRMEDFGERTTGTKDEHYNLISILYHALHGADNCDHYAMDAEASRDERLAAFFREAQAAQVQIAERGKELLGIVSSPPEFDAASEDPRGQGRGVPPTTDTPRGTPPGRGVPPGGAPPGDTPRVMRRETGRETAPEDAQGRDFPPGPDRPPPSRP
jgi:hypothetical protein